MKRTQEHDSIVFSSTNEKDIVDQWVTHFKNSPLPNEEVLANLGLFLTSKNLARLLFFYEIYKKIVHTHGIIVEFGVRWGQTLAVLSALRGIFEPFNRHRKIVGFDTFEGFRGMRDEDGTLSECQEGSFSVTPNYEDYLGKILSMQEGLNPIPHIKKYELVKGDAVETVPAYLKSHPETIISLAIFDFDIYLPTKVALQAVKPHLCRGSILVFDELCEEIFPGETIALNEVFGLNNVTIQRLPITSRLSYLEVQ